MTTTPPDGVRVRRGCAGLGLFTTREYSRGEFIIEYQGELINQAEADRRGGRYLFTVTDDVIIDGKSRHNIARYINHACKPNAYAEADIDEHRVRIYAKKRIPLNEEITYHYGKEYFDEMLGDNCRCSHCQHRTSAHKP